MTSLVSFTGLASGLDTASIVDALVNAQRAPIRRLQTKRADLNQQKGIFETIDGNLDSLSSVLDELNEPAGLASFSASSSDDTVPAATDATVSSLEDALKDA
ncbi:MAG: flagellar cap protein FliD N-terminal domain-containing protein, partial [Myxococcota bacterium]